MLAILNPQYAFLEADYANPNLKQFISKFKDPSEMENIGELVDANSNLILKMIPPNLYLKVNTLSFYVSSRYFNYNSVDRSGIFLMKSLNLLPN